MCCLPVCVCEGGKPSEPRLGEGGRGLKGRTWDRCTEGWTDIQLPGCAEERLKTQTEGPRLLFSGGEFTLFLVSFPCSIATNHCNQNT